MRISSTVFTLGSLALTAATVANAFVQKKQFYPAIVYITKSSPSMAVMYVQALILVYVLFQIVRKIFFGDLRASESEHLSERAWHAVMETCLAFAVFRDDFSPVFVAQFVILLFVKSFHWLCDDRVDMMERSPVITLKFHIRMLSLLAFLSSFDSYFVSHAYFTTLQKGASAQIVFGFEYSILMALVAHVSVKYMLHMYDARAVHPWEQKAVYLLYAELLINFIRCVLYAAFVLVMMKVHTFPLFSVRPFYLSVRALHKAFSDVVLSRRAINAMNNRFPLATEADLADVDTTCIICREEMTVGSGAKKLPCGHIFHANCLRSWFQRQQTCPTCRTDILNERRPGIVPPQGAQDNAVPPAGAFPPLFPAFLAQQFGFVPPPPPREQRPGQDAGANAAPIPPPPPFMPPPGFLPGLPGLPPFPLPPVATAFPAPPIMATLTDAELRELEGSTRSAVEARLRALSNIAVLLDAATAQFQQYIDVARRYPLNIPSDIHAGGGDGPSTSSETPTSSTNVNEAPRSLFSPSSSNSISTEEKKATVSSSSEAVSAATTADEIRRRRLQRLGEDPDNSSPPPEERAGPSSS